MPGGDGASDGPHQRQVCALFQLEEAVLRPCVAGSLSLNAAACVASMAGHRHAERNPVNAHLAARAEEYEWSSARLRLAGTAADLVDLRPWQAQYHWPRWQETLRSSIDEEAFGQRLREAGRRGRPLGDEQFVENLEKRCGRRLRARPVGRPKKASGEEGDQLSLGNGV